MGVTSASDGTRVKGRSILRRDDTDRLDELEHSASHRIHRLDVNTHAFAKALVVEARDTIRPSFYVRETSSHPTSTHSQPTSRPETAKPFRRERFRAMALVDPKGHNTNRAPIITGPVIELG